jgi:ADP-ribosylation factor-like protein 2
MTWGGNEILMNGFQRLLGASLLVFANKRDVDGCMTLEEIREVGSIHFSSSIYHPTNKIVLSKQGLRLDSIGSHKWTILSCSAMTGENLFKGLDWVIADAKERLFLY